MKRASFRNLRRSRPPRCVGIFFNFFWARFFVDTYELRGGDPGCSVRLHTALEKKQISNNDMQQASHEQQVHCRCMAASKNRPCYEPTAERDLQKLARGLNSLLHGM